jgi:hypothetical protein
MFARYGIGLSAGDLKKGATYCFYPPIVLEIITVSTPLIHSTTTNDTLFRWNTSTYIVGTGPHQDLSYGRRNHGRAAAPGF